MAFDKRLRVLQIVGNSVIGGAENHVLTLIRALDPAEFAIAVVCPRPGPLVETLESEGVRVHLIDHVIPAPNDEYDLSLSALWDLFALMHRWRPGIVHCHLYPAHLHGMLAGHLASIPALLTTAHTLIVRPGDAWLARLTPGRMIAVSQAAKSLLVGSGVPPRRIRVVYNGIEPRYFENEMEAGLKIRGQLGIPEDAPVVGVIARLSREKGHDTFLAVARDVLRQRPRARFLVVGDGPLREELESTAAALGIAAQVTFTGARRDITALNHALDVFLLPSREEALPLAVLEAMAAGRPILASAVGGVPEVVVDGQTGFLFGPNDRAGFVRALITLIDQPDLRHELGQHGRRRARARFGVERMVRETVAYYRACLEAAT